MKSILLILSLTCVSQTLPGAPVATIRERGPHHRVWERATQEQLPGGQTVERKSGYVEIGTFMHYWDDETSQWLETKEEIQIVNGFAVASQGPHRLVVAGNLNTPGAIDLFTPGGRFTSHILALAYTDAATGQSAIIGRIKDCEGVVVGPNVLYFMDAFDGDCEADVRLIYTQWGFEQDILIVAPPPHPGFYGLSQETSRLEVFTEFLNAPEATAQERILKREDDPQRRLEMVEPDLIDVHLNFGSMLMGTGHAFSIDEDPMGQSSVPTGKSWEVVDDRRFLIEKVDYTSIKPHLDALEQAGARQPRGANALNRVARSFPAPPNGQSRAWKETQVAQVAPKRAGFVIDYSLSGYQTNIVLRGDTTYLVGSTVIVYGNENVLEGGCVIKFSKPTSRLWFKGQIHCRTDPWRPAVFTAVDDDSVGAVISGSTGAPSGFYALYALQGEDTDAVYDLHDIRIRHAQNAIANYAGTRMNLSHAQITHCQKGMRGLGGSDFRLRNVLFTDMTHAFYGSSTVTNHVEHGTFHRIDSLLFSTNMPLALTNSLLISVTNNVVWTGSADNVKTNLDDTGIFQTVAEGAHYLSTNSTYRDIGTEAIDASLLRDLTQRTTYPPPQILTGAITADATWTPQAPRDVSNPDLGYHYDPLDYIVSGLSVSNATVLLTNGVTVGIDFDQGAYGLQLSSGSALVSLGSPLNLNRLVRLHAVQELGGTSGSNGCPTLADYYPSSNLPTAHLRFTGFPLMAGDYYHLRQEDNQGNLGELLLRDCQFRGGQFYTSPAGADQTYGWTNNLFDRVLIDVNAYADMDLVIRNTTFREGTLTLGPFSTNNAWVIMDSLFDGTNVSSTLDVTNDYNGYVTNAVPLASSGGHDTILNQANVTYESGYLGDFYLADASDLVDAGSLASGQTGLHRFTTRTNQAIEGSSQVDIGFHWVALNAFNEPLDSDGDGTPDYVEDVNGDGVVDSGESDPYSPDVWRLKVVITRPRAGAILP